MPQLEKFYSSFGGVDTRSNKMLMDKNTFRNGSSNFRYNFQDEIQKANGFQQKSPPTPVEFVDIFEYKFTSLENGEEQTQLLGVGVDGNLYRKVENTLSFISHVGFDSYSFYYDEISDDFCFRLNGANPVEIHFDESKTSSQLEDDINAVSGMVVDFSRASGGAYLLDCVIESPFDSNSIWLWEVVPHPYIRSKPGSDGLSVHTYNVIQTPFQTTLLAQTDPVIRKTYEGISAINQNNSIYMCDGGFMLKYDGKCVYRAGMPRTYSPSYNINGIDTNIRTDIPADIKLPANTYHFYKFRFGFTDANGFTSFGDIQTLPVFTVPPAPPAAHAYMVSNQGLVNGGDFPIFAAKVVGDQGDINGGPLVLNVESGHNILVGMCIRQVTNMSDVLYRGSHNSRISLNCKVIAVTETTITLERVSCTTADPIYNALFLDGEILNGYFTDPFNENKAPGEYGTSNSLLPVGAFLQVFRTKEYKTAEIIEPQDIEAAGPYYHCFDMSMPLTGSGHTSYLLEARRDNKDGTGYQYLNQLLDDMGDGGELPRAGKFVTQWQDSLVQLGRTCNPSLANDSYPSTIDHVQYLYCNEVINRIGKYTEALLCDTQSIYWADPLTPEGFPQDGLFEFRISTEKDDQIRAAIKNKDSLIAIKDASTSVLTGDLGSNVISMETLEDDIGIGSFKTLKDVNGSAMWLDPRKGFYSLVAGRLPVPVGWKISDQQRNNYEKLDYSKATAAVSEALDMYFCAVGSKLFVFDFSDVGGVAKRNCWYIWDRFNIQSIVGTASGEIIALNDRVWKLKNTNTKYDFTDHTEAIHMKLITAWWNWGSPTIDKKFNRIWVNSIQGGFNLLINQYGNYLDDLIGGMEIEMKPSDKKLTAKEFIKCIFDKLSAFSIGIENSEKNKFIRIQGFEVEYSDSFDPREPRR